jgi:cytochrome c553
MSIRLATLAAFSAFALSAFAQDSTATADTAAEPTAAPAAAPAPVTMGDAVMGEKLAYTCTGCHGIPNYKNAYPNYKVPKIAGQNYEYLLAALNGYREGARKHPTMRVQASSFSEQDIKDLAAYLSTLGSDAK